MPPAIYQAVKQQCYQALHRLYHSVASPIDGPGKVDYGDIDFLVAGPKYTGTMESKREVAIQAALGAEFARVEGAESHYAVAWPQGEASEDLSLAAKRYIQVDVSICASQQKLEWMLFKHAHGDVWSILGSVIRPFGLTVDDQALWLRIPEIEKSNRNRAKVLLTSEPNAILDFLGLPVARFWGEPFSSYGEMYEYAAQCNLFRVHQPTDASIPGDDTTGENATGGGKQGLNTSDRKRMNLRPAFRGWYDDFLPRCQAEGRYMGEVPSRDEVRLRAFELSGIEEQYQERLDEYKKEQQVIYIWNDVIKGTFPATDSSSDLHKQYRGCLVKALKKIILEDDRTFGIAPGPDSPMRDGHGFFILENVTDFISRYHEAIGAAAMERHRETSTRRLKEKQQRETSGQPLP